MALPLPPLLTDPLRPELSQAGAPAALSNLALSNAALPYAWPDLPGCQGRIKAMPEDFCVDELPLYPASGQGEHLYVLVWKRGVSTRAAVQRLSEATGVPLRSIGWAGQKDSQAVTTQWLSLHAADAPVHLAEGPDLHILDVTRHGNKLRRAHLRGNRFRIRVRDARVPPDWERLVGLCTGAGFPNLFGAQRFGPDGQNASAGRALLQRLRTARRLRDTERFLVHAFQSSLFNSLVARRLDETGALAQVLPGDLALLHRNGATFAVCPATVAEAQGRMDRGEVSPSAPLFGCRVPLAGGVPGEWERECLTAAALSLDSFRFGSKDASVAGERRSVRAVPADFAWHHENAPDAQGALVLEFTLGPGVYATALLRELMKTPDLDPGAAAPEEA